MDRVLCRDCCGVVGDVYDGEHGRRRPDGATCGHEYDANGHVWRIVPDVGHYDGGDDVTDTGADTAQLRGPNGKRQWVAGRVVWCFAWLLHRLGWICRFDCHRASHADRGGCG